MKRLFPMCLLPVLAMGSGITHADSGPGCGLGQNIFAGQSGLAAHVMAATTNGSSFNQLFGLSFDSLGCNGDTVITAQFQRDVFVAGNLDNIAHDAARGGGTHLESLATIMQIPKQHAGKFYRLTQLHYDELFSAHGEDSSTWLARLDGALADDPALARYVVPSTGS